MVDRPAKAAKKAEKEIESRIAKAAEIGEFKAKEAAKNEDKKEEKPKEENIDTQK